MSHLLDLDFALAMSKQRRNILMSEAWTKRKDLTRDFKVIHRRVPVIALSKLLERIGLSFFETTAM
jgi:hypothetical protein